MPPLRDLVTIVTGASEGIGRALCLELASHRARLVLAARNAGRLRDLATACEARGVETLVVPTDVAVEAECRALVERCVERFGHVDALVNNAGITMWARADGVRDWSIYERMMRVNYLGSVYCTLAALPHLKATRGRIVAVASLAGLTGVPERTAYAASKHAMVGLFESLRIELAGSGVSVTLIAPDFVRSEIHARALDGDGAPLGESPMQGSAIMSAEACARRIARAMARRERLVVTSRRGRLGRWVRLVAPALIDRIAARAIARRR